MLFFALLFAAVAVFFIQKKLFAAFDDSRINYKISFSSFEVFENSEFFMYETIINDSMSSLPDLRTTTTLDEGMKICYYDVNPLSKSNTVIDKRRSSLVSVFAMKPRMNIERRWRVYAEKRGVYSIDNVMMTVRDITGLYKRTFKYSLPVTPDNTVAVLPSPLELDKFFASSIWQNGSHPVLFSLITDPLDVAGIREYSDRDPFSKINWKATARTSRLMVNNEEHNEKNRFNIIMNMQSRETEMPGTQPEALNYVELGVKVCASLFDIMGSENAPVRFYSNAPHIPGYFKDKAEDDEGLRSGSRDFMGRGDTINALRMLAELRPQITCEFSSILTGLSGSGDGVCGTYAIVSSYINDTMIGFARDMRSKNIRTVFFLTSLVKSVKEIPGDVEVYYRTYAMPNEKDGERYA